MLQLSIIPSDTGITVIIPDVGPIAINFLQQVVDASGGIFLHNRNPCEITHIHWETIRGRADRAPILTKVYIGIRSSSLGSAEEGLESWLKTQYLGAQKHGS